MIKDNLKSKIISYAKAIGLSPVGICQSAPFDFLEDILRENNPKLTGFVEKDIGKRIDPQLSLDGVKSIITIGLPYDKQIPACHEIQTSLPAYISISAAGPDYHRIMNDKLHALSQYIKSLTPANILSYCDTGPLVERALGQRAGIGFIGKNTSLISADEGSYFYIGYLLTDLSLPPTLPAYEQKCGSCTRCIQACPAGALTTSGQMIYSRCISYLTQSKKDLTRHEMKTMGQQLYGCDICQRVCPYNRQKIPSATAYGLGIWDIPAILNMTQREFKQTIGLTAAGWRGKKWITRNALVNLTNIHTPQAKAWLEKYQNHENPALRHIAETGLEEW